MQEVQEAAGESRVVVGTMYCAARLQLDAERAERREERMHPVLELVQALQVELHLDDQPLPARQGQHAVHLRTTQVGGLARPRDHRARHVARGVVRGVGAW